MRGILAAFLNPLLTRAAGSRTSVDFEAATMPHPQPPRPVHGFSCPQIRASSKLPVLAKLIGTPAFCLPFLIKKITCWCLLAVSMQFTAPNPFTPIFIFLGQSRSPVGLGLSRRLGGSGGPEKG